MDPKTKELELGRMGGKGGHNLVIDISQCQNFKSHVSDLYYRKTLQLC